MNFEIKIIDNFFDISDFNLVNNVKLDEIESNKVKVYHNTIDKKNVVQQSCIDENLIEFIHKKYHQKVFEILKELNLGKSKLYDYTDLTIIKTGKNCKFPIHDDTPNKLLSGVIYLNPEINAGTMFYENKKGDNKKTIPWEKNRAVFFSVLDIDFTDVASVKIPEFLITSFVAPEFLPAIIGTPDAIASP